MSVHSSSSSSGGGAPVPGSAPLPGSSAATEPLVEVRNLVREFRLERGRVVRAVAGVDLDIREGEVLGLVGESGSGKTTVARCVLRLIDATSGSIRVGGTDVRALRGEPLRRLRREMQLVFQDPVGSLDPRMSVADLVAEPIRTHLRPDRASVQPLVLDLLGQVGLSGVHLDRRPHELSGGQCQRVAIARALALKPRLVVLDEPTSALDVSVQAQILNLLTELRASHGLTYLLISHDLGVVRHLSDRIAVMYLGRIVEQGTRDEVFESARHPYSRALLAAVPDVESGTPRPALVRGDPPSAAAPPAGCRFHPRCWLRARLEDPAECEQADPGPAPASGEQSAACHFAGRTAAAILEEVSP